MTMTTDTVWPSNGPSQALVVYRAIAKELGQLQAEEGADPAELDRLKKELDTVYSKLTQKEKDEVAGENSQE
jgi:hypothetical protein